MAQVVSNLQLFVYHCSNIYNSLGFRACCFLAAIRSHLALLSAGSELISRYSAQYDFQTGCFVDGSFQPSSFQKGLKFRKTKRSCHMTKI